MKEAKYEKRVWKDEMTRKRVWKRVGYELWGSNYKEGLGMGEGGMWKKVYESQTSNRGQVWERGYVRSFVTIKHQIGVGYEKYIMGKKRLERKDLWKRRFEDHTTRKSWESQEQGLRISQIRKSQESQELKMTRTRY